VAQRLEVIILGRAAGGDRLAVAGDLAAGQRVITLGHEALADGAPVRVGAASPGAGHQIGRRPGGSPAERS
jgi:hypothetical protein